MEIPFEYKQKGLSISLFDSQQKLEPIRKMVDEQKICIPARK